VEGLTERRRLPQRRRGTEAKKKKLLKGITWIKGLHGLRKRINAFIHVIL
jgi:hypothetical protein